MLKFVLLFLAMHAETIPGDGTGVFDGASSSGITLIDSEHITVQRLSYVFRPTRSFFDFSASPENKNQKLRRLNKSMLREFRDLAIQPSKERDSEDFLRSLEGAFMRRALQELGEKRYEESLKTWLLLEFQRKGIGVLSRTDTHQHFGWEQDHNVSEGVLVFERNLHDLATRMLVDLQNNAAKRCFSKAQWSSIQSTLK